MERKEPYQFKVRDGDVVKLPNGDLGIVASCEILCFGHVLHVSVFPFVGAIKRFFGSILGWYEFYDSDINSLVRVGSLVE